MKNLSKKRCAACDKETLLVSAEDVQAYLDLMPSWHLTEGGKSIERVYTFKNFVENMHFVDSAADIAEEEGHHPDMHIFYDKLRIEICTHAIGGLSEADFILASKIETLHENMHSI